VKIDWLITPRQSLRVHIAFIAAENPDAARRVRQRIHAAVSNLGRFPDAGRAGEVAGNRELLVPGLPYLIVYRVRCERVEILRVLHTAMQRTH
jgi:plasmid stabilization system protein ParE